MGVDSLGADDKLGFATLALGTLDKSPEWQERRLVIADGKKKDSAVVIALSTGGEWGNREAAKAAKKAEEERAAREAMEAIQAKEAAAAKKADEEAAAWALRNRTLVVWVKHGENIQDSDGWGSGSSDAYARLRILDA